MVEIETVLGGFAQHPVTMATSINCSPFLLIRRETEGSREERIDREKSRGKTEERETVMERDREGDALTRR